MGFFALNSRTAAVAAGRGARIAFRLLRAVAEVGAGAEVLALRAQHRGAAIRIGVECVECVAERIDQRDVEEIVRRALDLDHGHVAFLRDFYIAVFHRNPLCIARNGSRSLISNAAFAMLGTLVEPTQRKGQARCSRGRSVTCESLRS
jgi:hypothetical protein